MEYTQRSESRFANALATLGSQIPFKEESILIKVSKQQTSIIETFKKMFPEEPDEEDWQSEIKREVGKLERRGSIKELKDYTLIKGELYRRLPREILSRCISENKGKMKLEELHIQICMVTERVNLYRRIQHMGYYWPNMSKEVTTIQEKCQNCQLWVDKEESYAIFVVEEWRTPFVGYLTEGILLADKKLAHQLKKLAIPFFCKMGSCLKESTTGIP